MSEAQASIVVLHVDDEPGFADVTARHLERESAAIEVRTETSAGAALDRIEAESVDCVVSDYEMPGMDGLALLAAVRDAHPDLPFVLFTGRGSEEIASEAISAGVTDYLRKGSGTDQFAILANRIENAVEQARSRVSYRGVFENVDVGLTVRDVETGELVDANPRYCDLLGYDRETALGFGFEDVTADVEGYDRERAMDLLQRATTEDGFTFEWPDRRADGTTRWVEVGATEVEIEGRERVLATVRDVHDRHVREETLETLHRVAAEIQGCDTIEAACERTVEAAESILEFRMCTVVVEEDGWLVPKAVSEDAPDDGARRMGLDQGMAGETYQSGESSLVTDFASADDVDPARTDYRSGISVPIGDVGVFQAATEEPGGFTRGDLGLAELLVSHTARTLDRLRFEAELRRQNERLDDFARVLSHDLRNPLTVAKAELAMASEACDSDHLAHLDDALDRIDDITQDTLRLARHGGSVEERERVDLRAFATRCWGMVTTGDADLVVEEPVTLRADPDRLGHVIENCFRNAVQHAGTDPVTVRVGALEDGFYVADDGPGIPADEYEDVFETGYTTADDGTGFGLAIVAEFAAAHGWDVAVAESAGGGARFAFTGVELVE